MKTQLFILVSAITLTATAQEKIPLVLCTWTASPDSDVAFYTVYYQKTDPNLTPKKKNSYTTALLLQDELFTNTPYMFFVTATDTAGNESAPSDTAYFRATIDRPPTTTPPLIIPPPPTNP